MNKLHLALCLALSSCAATPAPAQDCAMPLDDVIRLEILGGSTLTALIDVPDSRFDQLLVMTDSNHHTAVGLVKNKCVLGNKFEFGGLPERSTTNTPKHGVGA